VVDDDVEEVDATGVEDDPLAESDDVVFVVDGAVLDDSDVWGVSEDDEVERLSLR
jgi:hypothetical protein